jgi:hypothetical protein
LNPRTQEPEASIRGPLTTTERQREQTRGHKGDWWLNLRTEKIRFSGYCYLSVSCLRSLHLNTKL